MIVTGTPLAPTPRQSQANAAIRFLTREFGFTPREDNAAAGGDWDFDILAADN